MEPRDNGNYMISDKCPLHWYIPISSQIGNIDEFVKIQSSQNNNLITALLVAVFTIFGYFLFFT